MVPSKRQPANVLITVLWIIVALTILVAGLSFEARSDVERAILNRDRARAYWMARGGVERVKLEYGLAQIAQDPDGKDKLRYRYEFNGGYAVCNLRSVNAAMSVNTTNEDVWDQLLKLYDLDMDQRAEIIDAILDWRDQNDLLRVNGAENDYYQSLSPPYLPRNGPFFSVEELLLVRGITEDMFYGNPGVPGDPNNPYIPGLVDILTVKGPGVNRFDLNSCSKGVLMAFLEVTAEDADRIIAARENQIFRGVHELQDYIETDINDQLNRFFMTFQGGHFVIRSTGYLYDSAARYTIEDEVRYTGSGRMFSHLSHKDFSLDHVRPDSTPIDEDTP